MPIDHYQQKNLPAVKPDVKNDPEKYKPSDALINALNVALELNMPLLLTGEPGTGKTQFAHHIAHRFGLGKVLVFNAKTTSIASDLFYRYQAVKHFQYIQNIQHNSDSSKSVEDFIEFEALGKAIRIAMTDKKRSVVLIDEIDKAPRDFPNDILNELENLEFSVPEMDQKFKAPDDLRPIIILTSNSEKNLPAPFLRRCAYVNIDFPKGDGLLKIVQNKLPDYPDMQTWITEFEKIRERAAALNTKKPATAEFISWLIVLKELGFQAADLNSSDKNAQLLQSYSVLAKSEELLKDLAKKLSEK
ncbi:MAG: MoxR family ATPase [Bacteroidia bacterium]|nr:MoxR family ATPase [Bacteroidia bacterium]